MTVQFIAIGGCIGVSESTLVCAARVLSPCYFRRLDCFWARPRVLLGVDPQDYCWVSFFALVTIPPNIDASSKVTL